MTKDKDSKPNAACYLKPAHSKRHYLTIRKGQYWGFHVDLSCSRCNMTATVLKSAIKRVPYGKPVELRVGA